MMNLLRRVKHEISKRKAKLMTLGFFSVMSFGIAAQRYAVGDKVGAGLAVSGALLGPILGAFIPNHIYGGRRQEGCNFG